MAAVMVAMMVVELVEEGEVVLLFHPCLCHLRHPRHDAKALLLLLLLLLVAVVVVEKKEDDVAAN
jgi:hypothetical protein